MWVDIKGWENLYEIDENSNVRNKQTGNLIIGDINSSGYHRVCLYNKDHNPPKQRFFRHRLVATHFISNPENLPEVNHKDSNKDHNYSSNLEWTNKKTNELHARVFGSKEYKPFITIFNDNRIKFYDAKSDLASLIGVTPRSVKNWLDNINNGYKEYGIKTVKYLEQV